MHYHHRTTHEIHDGEISPERQEVFSETFLHVVRCGKDLDALSVRNVQHPGTLASLTALEVDFRDEHETPSLRLNAALRSLCNLTVLVLDISFPVPSTIFQHVSFPRLEVLKSNLQHSVLVSLLDHYDCSRHEEVKLLSLSLGAPTCDHLESEPCPLSACRLETVTELTCPIECGNTISRKCLVRLTGWHKMTSTTASKIMRSWIPFPRLSELSLLIPSDDAHCLAHIPTFAPHIRTLKITQLEVTRSGTGSRHILSSNFNGWTPLIVHLTRLDTLLVRMPSPFVRHMGNLREEKEKLLSWLTGRHDNQRYSGTNPRIIGVHYGGDIGGVLSYWSVGKVMKRFSHVHPTGEDNVLF